MFQQMTRKLAIKSTPPALSAAPENKQSYGSNVLASRVIGPFNSVASFTVVDKISPSTAALVKTTVSPTERYSYCNRYHFPFNFIPFSLFFFLQPFELQSIFAVIKPIATVTAFYRFPIFSKLFFSKY